MRSIIYDSGGFMSLRARNIKREPEEGTTGSLSFLEEASPTENDKHVFHRGEEGERGARPIHHGLTGCRGVCRSPSGG
jgi:hypothetical protein